MTQEQFTHILICYKCYKYEDHATKDCPTTTPTCSECAETGHTYRDCPNEYKRCLNCPAPNNTHRTLAAKCPYRKKTIDDKNKRNETQQTLKQNQTYSNIVKETMKQARQDPVTTTNVTLTDKIQLKLTAIILEAHIACLNRPDEFGQTLSQALKANYDIDATFPNRDSQDIFRMYYPANLTRPDYVRQEEDIPQSLPDIEMTEATDKRRRTSSNDEQTPVPAPKTHRTKQSTPDRRPLMASPNRFDQLNDNTELQSDAAEWIAVKPKQKRKTSRKRSPQHIKQTTSRQTDLSFQLTKAQDHNTNLPDLPDLDAGWRTEHLEANLPQPLPQRQQKSPKTPEYIAPKDLGLRLLRNKDDPTPLPNILDKDYLTNALTERTENRGLKVNIKTDHDLGTIASLLTEGLIPVNRNDVFTVPNDKFVRLPRISKGHQ